MQHECIPQAILGMDVLCQAKSGMGKTAVFVLSVLQQIEPTTPAEVGAIVLCHTRELAYQVCPQHAASLPYVRRDRCFSGPQHSSLVVAGVSRHGSDKLAAFAVSHHALHGRVSKQCLKHF